MKNYLKNTIVQLIAWHSFLVSVVIGAPLLLTLGSLGVMDWPAAAVLSVACVHLGLILVQISLTGEAVPKGWGGVWFLAVPLLYLCTIPMTYRLGAVDWLMRSVVLLIHSGYVSWRILYSAWQNMTHSDQATRLNSDSQIGSEESDGATDESSDEPEESNVTSEEFVVRHSESEQSPKARVAKRTRSMASQSRKVERTDAGDFRPFHCCR